MKIPEIDFRNIEKSKESIIKIDEYLDPIYDDDEWKVDAKSLTKYIKKIERFIRGSVEYKNYIKFLRDEIDMTQCYFFQNVSSINYKVGIEIHHSPLTLYDIVAIILNYMEINEITVNSMKIANTVMECHYKGLIGLIPLSETVHELVHSGEIFIPVDKVYGDFRKFKEIYGTGFTQEHDELLEEIIESTKQFNKEKNYSPSILERNFVYLEVEGMEFPKRIQTKSNKIA